MSFWTTEKLKREQTRTPLEPLIAPFDVKRVKQGAYELSLGPEAFVTSGPSGTKKKLRSREQMAIPAGQFALLLTEEVVRIPNNAIGFISVRFSLKRRGIVNVSGFHVDSGFVGRLKFAVYNAGSQKIVVARGEPIFMIWYSELSEPTADLYKGDPCVLNEITSRDVNLLQGEVASPGELKKQLDELKSEFTIWKTLLLAILGGLLILFLKSSFEQPSSSSSPNQNVNTQENKEAPTNRSVPNNNLNPTPAPNISPALVRPEPTK
jgi:dCTP deaminase